MTTGETELNSKLDFKNTEIAFKNRSDRELNRVYRLFKLMNNQVLVEMGSNFALAAFKLQLPFVNGLVKKSIFSQFCGGENLLDCQSVIDDLNRFDTLTILEYGAESKSGEENLNLVTEEILKGIQFAASNSSVPVVSVKLTGLADNEVFELIQKAKSLNTRQQQMRDRLYGRVHKLCSKARDLGVGLYIDAEESWMQDTIDQIVHEMMAVYNKAKAVVHNTAQMYRIDRLNYLKGAYETARKEGYFLGMKLVRGAYMNKERDRAKELGYPSPIQPDKTSTDKDFNEAIRFCVDNYEHLSSCCASHNIESCLLQADLIIRKGLRMSHPHLNFCQLYGMADYITFNLAHAGFNVAKNIPYGPVREVIPYLIRRAQENTAVTGEMSRELKFISEERERRGLR